MLYFVGDVLQIKHTKKLIMINRLIFAILLFTAILGLVGCEFSSENNSLKIDTKNVSQGADSVKVDLPKAGDLNIAKEKKVSFTISCGSGCAMTYDEQSRASSNSLYEIKFKIQLYIDEVLSEENDETYVFEYDSVGKVKNIHSKHSQENILFDNDNVIKNDLIKVAKTLYSQNISNRENSKIKLAEENKPVMIQKEGRVVKEPNNLFDVLLPTSYRIFDNNDPTKELTSDWFDLLEKGGVYYLEKAAYVVSKGYDECAGVETKVINTKRNSILLLGYKKLTPGRLDNLLITKKYVWPKESMSFDFKGVVYTLTGVGDIKSTESRTNDKDENEIWHEVKNYKLYLKTSDKNEQLIISESNFSDTFVTLIFVGDIDRDGKLDFIFQANRDYEETRMILFLSSEAEGNKIIRKVSEVAIQFDC
jgi:hypothetical protein